MSDERRNNSDICERLSSIETVLRDHLAADALFMEKYGGLIDLLLVRETTSAKLRQVVIEKLITGGMWAFVIFLALASWEFVKRMLK